MHLDLATLFCRHAAVSFGKQLLLAELIGSFDWHFDMPLGLLSFGDKYQWCAQILGTEADDSQTWLWAWANEASNIPIQLLGSALTLRMLGEAHGIPELAEPELPLEQIDGHILATIGSSVCRADAYYRCPYEGGAAFVLIKDENFPRCTEPPLARIASVFPQAISAIEIPDHRLAFTSYLEYYGIAFEGDGMQVVAKEGDEPVLTAAFDELNRLMKLEATICARPNCSCTFAELRLYKFRA
jgi:hypothetical protein